MSRMQVGRCARAVRAIPIAVALTVSATPASLSGQGAPADLGIERLTTFARVHLAIADARDAFHGQIGRLHEEQSRLQARRQMLQKVAEILEAEGLTQEEYDRFILIISTDAETRAAFEKVLAELVERTTGAGHPLDASHLVEPRP